jgi:hypothetical protein
MFFLRRKKTAAPGLPVASLSRLQALQCIPVKNPEVQEHAAENGELLLVYQVRIKPWFAGVVRKMTGSTDNLVRRKLQLDLLGSSVWGMIDGHRSVEDIVASFQDDHQLTRRESELSVTAFLRELGKRGLVALHEEEG